MCDFMCEIIVSVDDVENLPDTDAVFALPVQPLPHAVADAVTGTVSAKRLYAFVQWYIYH